jgi:N4-gp56 family major capsid protein
MARTTILPTDPNKRKAWAAKVAEDSIKDQYFARMEGEEGSNSAVVRKTDLESGKGDEVVTALVAKLRGTPITEGKKLEGAEFKLANASHTMRINEFRHGVNVGARIEQSRVGYNLKKQGRERLTDYISEMYEEVIAMAANGARGTGNEIQHFGTDWTGYPNAFRAPDAAHYFVGTDNTKTFATLVNTAATDTITLKTINKLRTKAKKMMGGQPDGAVKIEQVVKGGKKCYILAVCPEVMQDIRDDAGAQGWFEAQKALTAAIGKESEIFKGGAGMFNTVLVDEMDTCVKFNTAGAGGNLNAARSLFLGANAIVVAHGSKGIADGMTVGLSEDTDDRGHDSVLDFEVIFGADKSQFNSMDYGMVTIDSNFTVAV